MTNSNTIILKPGMTVNVDGVELTFEEIMNNKIDSHLFRKHIRALQGDSE